MLRVHQISLKFSGYAFFRFQLFSAPGALRSSFSAPKTLGAESNGFYLHVFCTFLYCLGDKEIGMGKRNPPPHPQYL